MADYYHDIVSRYGAGKRGMARALAEDTPEYDVVVGRFANSADDYEYTCLVKKQSNTLVGDKVMRPNWTGPLTVTKLNPETYGSRGRPLKVAKLHSRKLPEPQPVILYVPEGTEKVIVKASGRCDVRIERGP